jgi:hypothetical protein
MIVSSHGGIPLSGTAWPPYPSRMRLVSSLTRQEIFQRGPFLSDLKQP